MNLLQSCAELNEFAEKEEMTEMKIPGDFHLLIFRNGDAAEADYKIKQGRIR